MQRDPTTFTGIPSLAHEYEADGCIASGQLGGHHVYGVPVSPAFGVPVGVRKHPFPSPLGGFEFQPSKNCPRNFIIFDRTDEKSCFMYPPALIHKLSPANFNAFSSHAKACCKSLCQHNKDLDSDTSSFKEDTREIDALLSSDEDEDDDDKDVDDEDDVVSTGRTPGHFESGALDSSSSLGSKKSRFPSTKSSTFYGSVEDDNKKRMRKMVTVLREIIPGGDQLDTPAVLEEAVRYLKYLKMEVKKLGVQSFDD